MYERRNQHLVKFGLIACCSFRKSSRNLNSSNVFVCFQCLCVSRFSRCGRRDVCTVANLVCCQLWMWPGSFQPFPFLDYLVVGHESGGTKSGTFFKNQTTNCFFLLASWLNNHLCFVMPHGRSHDVHQSVIQRHQWGFSSVVVLPQLLQSVVFQKQPPPEKLLSEFVS